MSKQSAGKECMGYLMGLLLCGGFGWSFMLIGMGVLPGAWRADDMIIISDNPANCTASHCFIVRHDNNAICLVPDDTGDFHVGEIQYVYYQGDDPVYSKCTFEDRLTVGFFMLIGIIPTLISCFIVVGFLLCGSPICYMELKKRKRTIMPSTSITNDVV